MRDPRTVPEAMWSRDPDQAADHHITCVGGQWEEERKGRGGNRQPNCSQSRATQNHVTEVVPILLSALRFHCNAFQYGVLTEIDIAYRRVGKNPSEFPYI